jgi:hypothetical protein
VIGKIRPPHPKLIVMGLLLLACSVIALVVSGSLQRSFTRTPQSIVQANAQSDMQHEGSQDIYKYLPPGARIEDQSRSLLRADLDGDGLEEVVIFYTTGTLSSSKSVGFIVLKLSGHDYVRVGEKSYTDSSAFSEPTGVYDLSRTHRAQLVVYRVIGASCPGVLEIYALQEGKLIDVTGPWAEGGKCQMAEVKDIDGDGISEIIVKNRKYSVSPDIYRWDGKKYSLSNVRFPKYYNDDLAEVLQSARSLQAVPVAARVKWCEEAVKIYLLQHRYAEAIQLCEEVLRTIDDPRLTTPGTVIRPTDTPEQQNHILAWFEVEKIEGKAKVHRLLGDINKASENVREAQSQYTLALELEREAKEQAGKL